MERPEQPEGGTALWLSISGGERQGEIDDGKGRGEGNDATP